MPWCVAVVRLIAIIVLLGLLSDVRAGSRPVDPPTDLLPAPILVLP